MSLGLAWAIAVARGVLKLTDSASFGLDSVTDCHRTVTFPMAVKLGVTDRRFWCEIKLPHEMEI
jgi:hypothetical protein